MGGVSVHGVLYYMRLAFRIGRPAWFMVFVTQAILANGCEPWDPEPFAMIEIDRSFCRDVLREGVLTVTSAVECICRVMNGNASLTYPNGLV